MSEPVMWRTQFGCAAKTLRKPRFSHSPLARTLSLCSVLSILFLAVAPAHAQSAGEPAIRYSIESNKAASTLMLDVAHAGKRLVVVGDRGHILYSDDDGNTWVQAKVPTRQLLTAVYFVDDKHGWAVGHDALILATNDGGETWTRQYENREGEVPLLDVWFENPQHGFATGAYGVLLETTDGQNWEDVADRLDNEDGSHLNAIAEIKGSGLFVVGEMGGMFRSADMGETWERVESPYQGSFFGVVGGSDPGVVVAFGLRGNLFRSTDFGDSWQPIELLDDGDALETGLADGNLLPDGRIVVVGHGGTVLSSDDKGRSFKLFSRPDRRSLSGVVTNQDGNLVLVGQSGVRVVSPSGANLPVKQQ
ncbi:YCF48-related protein [Pseudomonas sp. Q2-TVG4-2]|uniref:WD40/YVTN/BNR-like repeat-containing protein n=1 Tax=Pseudomonas sp. Q2-TVG4-2 TaxID=1685699 RepID=UPI0015E77265|nr:YCF48-related protein [Pseudomonas sp. Q2-TVG4-2]